MRKGDVEALAQCNEAKRHLDELYNWTNADPKVHALLADLDEQLAFGNKVGQIYKMTSAKHWGTTERSSWTTHKRATPTLDLFKGTFKEGADGALAETATEDEAGVTNDGDAEIMATVLAITKRRDASKKARDAVIHELYRSEMQEGGWQLDDAMKNATSEQVEAELAAAADPSRRLPKEAEAAVMPPWIVPDAEEEEGATAAVEDVVGAVAGEGKEGLGGGGGEEAEEEAALAQEEEEEVEAVSASLRLRGYTVSTFGAAPRAALSAALTKVLALGSGALVSVGGVTGSGAGAAAGGAPGATPDLSQRWKQRREAGLGVGGAGGGRGAPGTVTAVVEILIPVLGAAASARGAAATAAAREAARARAASKAARVAAQLDAMSRAAADGGASRSADATFNTRLLAAFTAALEPEAAQPGAARQRAGAVPAGLAVAVLPSARPRTARSEAGGGAGPQNDEALARGWALLERVPTAAAEGGSGEGGGGEGDGPAADFVGDEDDVCSVASFRSLACEALRERNEKLSHHLRAAHPDRPPTARPATAGSSSSSSSRRPRTPGALTAAAVGRMDGAQKRAVAAAVAGARRATRPGTSGSSAGPGASRRTRRVVGGTARRRAGNNGGGGSDAGSLTARSVNPFPEFDNKRAARPGTARRAAAAPSSSAALVRPRTSGGGSEAGSARISGPLRGRMKVARQMLLECKPPSKRGHLDGVMFNIPGAPKGPKCFLTTKRVAERFDKEKRRDTSEHANDIEWNLKRNGETDYQDAKVKWIRQMGGMR